MEGDDRSMSFIVKGIDLPEEGQQLKIIVCQNGQTIIDMRTYTEEAEAIQIPKDHGRIGDLDGVIKRIDKSPTFASKYKDTARLFIDAYSDSNTILEEEEQE
jgi:hypothetical protein